MDSHLPIIVIELVLTFGGVLLFGWWQLRSIKRDQQAAAAKKPAEAATSKHRAEPPSENDKPRE
jgi:hypothetical protein